MRKIEIKPLKGQHFPWGVYINKSLVDIAESLEMAQNRVINLVRNKLR